MLRKAGKGAAYDVANTLRVFVRKAAKSYNDPTLDFDKLAEKYDRQVRRIVERPQSILPFGDLFLLTREFAQNCLNVTTIEELSLVLSSNPENGDQEAALLKVVQLQQTIAAFVGTCTQDFLATMMLLFSR